MSLPFVFTTILKMLVLMDRTDICWSIIACIYKLDHDCNPLSTFLIDAYAVCGVVSVNAEDVFYGIIDNDMVCWRCR